MLHIEKLLRICDRSITSKVFVQKTLDCNLLDKSHTYDFYHIFLCMLSNMQINSSRIRLDSSVHYFFSHIANDQCEILLRFSHKNVP